MIGIICAEKSETANLTKLLKTKIIEFNGFRFYIGNINNKQVVICFSGVGKVNAAAACMNMIINFNPEKILNIGLCGSCRADVTPGSVIIADNLEYSDVDVTPLNYPLNQIPEEQIRISVKDDDIGNLKSVIDNPIVGTICSGDTFVSLNNVESFPSLAHKDVAGFEMEAMALACVCHKTKTDFICVKVVSDNMMFGASSNEQYKTNYKDLTKKIEHIAYKILDLYTK